MLYPFHFFLISPLNFVIKISVHVFRFKLFKCWLTLVILNSCFLFKYLELLFSMESFRKLRKYSYLGLSKLTCIDVWVVVLCECVGAYSYMHARMHVCMCVTEEEH